MKDSIVEEIRRLRDDYAKRFRYDLSAICRDLREKQGRSGRKVAAPRPRRAEPSRQKSGYGD